MHRPLAPWTAEHLAEQSRAPGTWRGYAANWRSFSAWCATHDRQPLPAQPETVGAYLADQGQRLKPATLDRHHPSISEVVAGLHRLLGVRSQGKAALTTEELRAILVVLPHSLAGIRDRAVLLLTFAAALRRSEAAQLNLDDLTFTSEGMVVKVRRSKEDQEARGMLKGVPFGEHDDSCPVRAVRRWIMAARLAEGPLFRQIDRYDRLRPDALSGAAVAAITKKAVDRWAAHDGMSRAERARRVAEIGGHSLRAGFCTSAASAWRLDVGDHAGHRTSPGRFGLALYPPGRIVIARPYQPETRAVTTRLHGTWSSWSFGIPPPAGSSP